MKKICTFLMVILMVVFCTVSGFSESPKTIDPALLTSMTDDELISADQQIGLEIAKRGLSVSLPQGMYVVGKDIAPGSYRIKTHVTKGDPQYFRYYVLVYADSAMESRKLEKSAEASSEFFVSLEEGQVLDISIDTAGDTEGMGYIEKTAGLFME